MCKPESDKSTTALEPLDVPAPIPAYNPNSPDSVPYWAREPKNMIKIRKAATDASADYPKED